MSLESAIQHLLKAKRITASSQSYRKDNPGEYAKVRAYLDGGARPTGVTTEMGIGLLEVEDERRAIEPPSSAHLTGAHWVEANEYATLAGIGYDFAITTVQPTDISSATTKLDAARAAGIKLIIGIYPEPYTWNGSSWTISPAGITMLNHFKSRESDTIGLFVFNEPYHIMGLSSEQLRLLRVAIKGVWPNAQIYLDIGAPRRYAAGGDLQQGTKWTDQSDVADLVGIWYYPFRIAGGYQKAQGLASLAAEAAFVIDHIGGTPVFLGQSHSYPPHDLDWPTDFELNDWNDAIRAALPVSGYISWYVWRQAIYPDVLANHPSQWPMTVP